jgi:fibronectin type 3 domain-containing protein
MYRSTTTSAAYGLLASAVSGTTDGDQTAQSGAVYYYAVTSVNSAGQESDYSNQIKVIIP